MTRTSPPLRRMFDVLTACPHTTADMRIDYLAETLMARGMTRESAMETAADAHAKWDAATRTHLGG